MNLKEYIEDLKKITEKDPNARKFYEWVLKNAKEFEEKDFGQLTEQEKKYVEEIKPPVKPKQCYYVSQILAVSSRGKLKYFEGWFLDRKIPIPLEHAWNVFDNKIVDLVEEKIHGQPMAYFGVQIPTEFVAKNMVKTGMAETILAKFFFSKKKLDEVI